MMILNKYSKEIFKYNKQPVKTEEGHMRIMKGLISTMIMLVFLVSSLTPIIVKANIPPEQDAPIKVESGNHLPIHINGNNEFTEENGVSSGDGTQNSPYMIQNWVIAKSGSAFIGIFIENTSAYFTIQNCTIHGFTTLDNDGLKFLNVTNGHIISTKTYRNYYGMVFANSSLIKVEQSCCHDNFGAYVVGFIASNCKHLTFNTCQSYNMTSPPSPVIICDGFDFLGTSNCVLENCSIHDNMGIGILSLFNPGEPVKYNSYMNCTIFNNQVGGIRVGGKASMELSGMGHNKIYGCHVFNTSDIHTGGTAGIVIEYDHHDVIERCTLNENHQDGIVINQCTNEIISNCSMTGSPKFDIGVQIIGPIYSLWFCRNIMEHCDINGLSIGILYVGVGLCHFDKNNIVNNDYGVYTGNMWSLFTSARFNSNNIYGNNHGMYVFSRGNIDARNNWWGSVSGPTRKSGHYGDTIETAFFGRCLSKPWAKAPVPDAGVIPR